MSQISDKPARTRTEPDEKEIEIRQNAISSQIRKDFLTVNVSYVDTKELTYLVGKVRQTKGTHAEIQEKLLSHFNAVSVKVNTTKTAIVKRPL